MTVDGWVSAWARAWQVLQAAKKFATMRKREAAMSDRFIGEFDPGPNAERIGDAWVIKPDSDAEPGEWSPFDAKGNLDLPRLEAEGWTQIGALDEDGLQ